MYTVYARGRNELVVEVLHTTFQALDLAVFARGTLPKCLACIAANKSLAETRHSKLNDTPRDIQLNFVEQLGHPSLYKSRKWIAKLGLR